MPKREGYLMNGLVSLDGQLTADYSRQWGGINENLRTICSRDAEIRIGNFPENQRTTYTMRHVLANFLESVHSGVKNYLKYRETIRLRENP